MQTPAGTRTFAQTENVQMKLDGSTMLIEGNGKDSVTGAPVFSALGIVAIDEASGKFRFRAFNDGHYLDTEAVVDKERMQWGFTPPGSPRPVRFTITLTRSGEWFEIGETSADGVAWQKFFRPRPIRR